MVSIRLQRTGRRRHAQFRMVVQDSRRAPTSGRVIAVLGFYNPHTQEHKIDLEQALGYLNNGAQPSSRVVKFMLDQKVQLPAWVKRPSQKTKQVKHPEKLRRNRPAEPAPEEKAPKAESATSAGKPSEAQDDANEAPIVESEQEHSRVSEAVDEKVEESTSAEESVKETVSETESVVPEDKSSETEQEDAVVAEEKAVDEKVEESTSAEESVKETVSETESVVPEDKSSETEQEDAVVAEEKAVDEKVEESTLAEEQS